VSTTEKEVDVTSMTEQTDSNQKPRQRRRDRDGIVEVCMSLRQAIDRVIALPELTASEAKVFLVVVRDVTSWSRLWDVRSREEIAATAGVSERTVSRAMDRLVEVGAVSWQPSRTKGKVSQVGLPDPDHGTTAVSPMTPTTGQLMSRTIEEYVEKKEEEASAIELVNVMEELARDVNPKQADQIASAPEVLKAARALVAAGRTPDDLRAGWAEKVPKVIGTGPRLAVEIMERVAKGEHLPAKAKRARRGHTSNAPNPPEAFGPSSTELRRWGA